MIPQIKKCLKSEAQALIELSNSIDEGVIPFLDYISKCKGKIFCIGVGKSLMVARKIASSFSSVGIASIEIDPLRLLHGDLGVLSNEDLIIAISNSGETDILVTALQYAKGLGVEIISITGNANSSIAKMSASHILVKTEEAGAFALVPSSSTTLVMALGDAILCGLVERNHIPIQEFFRYHPGGVLGRMEGTK